MKKILAPFLFWACALAGFPAFAESELLSMPAPHTQESREIEAAETEKAELELRDVKKLTPKEEETAKQNRADRKKEIREFFSDENRVLSTTH